MMMILGILISLIICFIIFSFFMDKKTLKIVFLTVIGMLVIVAFKVFLIDHSKPDFLKYVKLKIPAMELIAQTSPNEYQTYLENIENAKDNNEKLDITSKFFNAQFNKYLKSASNKLIYDYIKLTFNEYQSLAEKNPSLIVAIEYASKVSNQFKEKVDWKSASDFFEEQAKLKSEIIASGIKDPHPLTPEEYDKAKELTKNVFATLEKKYGAEKLRQVFSEPELDPALTAAVTVDLYKNTVEKGEETTALITKFIAS